MKWFLCIVLMLIPARGFAQTQWQFEDRLFFTGLGVYGGAAVWDARTTIKCTRLHVCREVNPIYVPIVNHHGVKTAMLGKLAVQSAIAGFLLYERPRHRKVTAWSLVILTGAQIAVDIGNSRRLKEIQR